MLLRRLVAGVLVLGMLVSLTLPAAGQDKDKDKDKGKSKDGGGEKVTLKWKFDKDKVFYQKMVTKTVQTMKVMTNDVNQTQNQTFYFSFKPTRVEADTVDLEMEIIGVAMDIEIGGSKISYDSTKQAGANNPLADFFKALIGSKFNLTLDQKTLKVTKIDGREGFIGKLVSANQQMKPLLESILSEDALKEMTEPTFGVLPTNPVAKGDKWTRTSKLNLASIGTYENTYTYTYEGTEGEGDKLLHKIKVDTTLNYKEPTGDSAGQGGLPFKIKSATLKSNNATGQVLFSAAKGRLEKSTNKLQLQGDLQIEIGGQPTTVNLSQTQDSTIETMDENPIKK